MHPLLSKINYTSLTIISGVSIFVLLGLLYVIKDLVSDNVFNALSNLLISILTCVLVSFWWNKFLLDASNHYTKSGIQDYYNDFSEIESTIKAKLKETKEATIFFMYGKTFINGSTSQIKEMLSKKDSKLIFVVASNENNFIKEYERFWNYPLRDNIENTPETLKNLFKEIDSKNRGQLKIYLYKDGGYSYSYYKLDNEVYLSPNKMVVAKTFKPITIYAQKTSNKNCLYNKVTQEFSFMLREKQIELIYDSENDDVEANG
ncbi:hypothetical protein LVY74_02455 [Acinetobacter sp. ME22]|uniref:hypothetical protein n=1 Tax=Acinetobacter sp. ME22 TaxID=2904802 RepID=UPI001EDA43C6|nr:hypothetical protein [Acinetobacter sp. ME22]MCG2572420.1 hypothetical protein [Acinetobacter sp. ME22]